MVDALASGASDRKVVEVRVLFWAPVICSRSFAERFKTLGNLLETSLAWPAAFAVVRVQSRCNGGHAGGQLKVAQRSGPQWL